MDKHEISTQDEDFEFIIEDDDLLEEHAPVADDTTAMPVLRHPDSPPADAAPPVPAHEAQPTVTPFVSASAEAEAPSDSIALPKRPNLMSGADELAEMQPSEELESAVADKAPGLESNSLETDAMWKMDGDTVAFADVEEMADAGRTEPDRGSAIDELAGIAPPENVVGGDDLIAQLDELESLDAPDLATHESEDSFESLRSLGDDFNDDPLDYEDPHGELADEEVYADDEGSSFTRSLVPVAAAALVILGVTFGTYMIWFHDAGTTPESDLASRDAGALSAPALADPEPAATDDTVASSSQLDLSGAWDDSNEDPTQALLGASSSDEREAASGTDIIAHVESEPEIEVIPAAPTQAPPSNAHPLIASSGHIASNADVPSDIEELTRTPLADNEIIIALKNGNSFQGKLKKANENEIVLRLHNGEITLPRETLRGILPEESEEYLPAASFPDGFVEFSRGNRIFGKILHVSTTRVVMDVAGARLIFPRSSVNVDYSHPVYVRGSLQ